MMTLNIDNDMMNTVHSLLSAIDPDDNFFTDIYMRLNLNNDSQYLNLDRFNAVSVIMHLHLPYSQLM